MWKNSTALKLAEQYTSLGQILWFGKAACAVPRAKGNTHAGLTGSSGFPINGNP